MTAHIVLAGEAVPVRPLDFRALRQILPRVSRALDWSNLAEADFPALLDGADQGLADSCAMIAAATGKTVAEIEAIPATVAEAVIAIRVICHVTGLTRPKEEAATRPGEPAAGESTGG